MLRSFIFLNENDYEIQSQLSQSNYLAVEKATGNKILIKSFEGYDIPINSKVLNSLFNYIYKPSRIKTTGIVKVKGIYFTKNSSNINIITEYMEKGNIGELNKEYFMFDGQNCLLNPTIRSKIIFGVACIMNKLHQNSIIHGSLSHKTIFLDDKLEPRISDAGINVKFSKYYSDDDMCRTQPNSWDENIFLAPEIILDCEEFSFKTDIYAFGSVVYRMFTEKIQIDGIEGKMCLFSFITSIENGKRPIKQDSIPEAYWNLIQKCWKQIPSERISFDEIVNELKDDKYAINEFGIKTNLDELHEYQNRIENSDCDVINDFSYNSAGLIKTKE